MGGLFSERAQIFIATTAYNLAGDIKDRIQVMPTAIAGAVLTVNNANISGTIQRTLMDGPGLRLRKFGRWAAQSGYTTAIDMHPSIINSGENIDFAQILPNLPKDPGELLSIQFAEVGQADYVYWVDQWLLLNLPNRIGEEYTTGYSIADNRIYITFVGGDSFSFTPVDYDVASRYLYVSYVGSTLGTVEDLVLGTPTLVSSPAEFPTITGWAFAGTTNTVTNVTLGTVTTTTSSYSDARPDEITETTDSVLDSYTLEQASWERTDYEGQAGSLDDDRTQSVLRVMNRFSGAKIETTSSTTVTTEDIGGGVIKTTTVVTQTDTLVSDYWYRLDTQNTVVKSWSKLRIYIYKEGSGKPGLDTQFLFDWDEGTFLPIIPVRLNNQMISPSYKPAIYALNKKAYKKAVGGKFDDLVAQIADNPDLDEIDHAYLVFGVSLNTPEKQGKKYIYKFFERILDTGLYRPWVPADYEAWRAEYTQITIARQIWADWKAAQADSGNPLFGTVEPPNPAYKAMPYERMGFYSGEMNYLTEIMWAGLGKFSGTGLGKPDAKRGDFWIVKGNPENFEMKIIGVRAYQINKYNLSTSPITIYWQETDSTYHGIIVHSLMHRTWIGGEVESLSAHEALDSSEESSFIIPMHEGIMRSMSLVSVTQISTYSSYLVLNSYQKVKKKWYQTDFFKMILVMVIIVIAVWTGGTGAGLLGPAASVGAALGFTGAAAVLIGTLANALAAMLLSKIVTAVSVKLFGEKNGAIIGAIASAVVLSVGTDMSNGGTMASALTNLGRSDNLLRLTVAAGGGYTEYLKNSVENTVAETARMLAEYEKKTEEISELWEQNLGFGQVYFDATSLTDVFKSDMPFPESSESFLSRTLLLGSEVASLSNDMLTNFTAVTLATPVPT